jgi:hemolysin activation/secretion protein
MSKISVILLVFLGIFSGTLYAQIPSSQTSGSITRQEQDIDRNRRMEERLREPIADTNANIEELTPIQNTESTAPAQNLGTQPSPQNKSQAIDTGSSLRKVWVSRIVVEDAALMSPEELAKITTKYENRGLSLDEIQQIADVITAAYRKKGYITSRAYVPVQTVQDNTLVIKVLEVKSGDVQIQGNKYFKDLRLRRELGVEPGGYFDFSALQQALIYINEHPDRKARAVLVPGKKPGTTDIVIDVAERRPFHAGFEYDNYGSRFVNKNRYSLILEHNNLLGFDDMAYFKAQISDDSRLLLQQFRYMFPITQKWDLGFYAVNSKLKLGKEFDSLDAEGDAQVYGLFSSHTIVKREDIEFKLNFGFDYKSIENEILGVQTSKDDLRVVKAGMDFDFEDLWGRNILSAEIDSGIPDFWGGSEAKDPMASRTGAGGRFDKGNFTFFRLQPLPKTMALLWKNIAQYSNHNLPASEQFQAGGAYSVRGYPVAEHFGDSGIYSALELSMPFYFIPKEMLVPLTKNELLYDDLRFVLFYDIAATHINNPLAGEEHNETLRGYGVGVRLNVQDNVTLRCEVGFPHGKKPSDGDKAHPWVEFTSRF